jgi:hypothetical protein
MLNGPPTNQSTQRRFEPSRGPANPPQPPPTARRRFVADQRAPRPASARSHDDARSSSPTFELWLTTEAKGGLASHGARRRGVPRAPRHIQAVRVSQAAPPYIRAAAEPREDPDPSRLGELLPCHMR